MDRVEEIAIMFLFSTAHRVLPCRSDNVVNNDNVDDVKNDKNVETIDNDGNFHSVAITSTFDTVEFVKCILASSQNWKVLNSIEAIYRQKQDDLYLRKGFEIIMLCCWYFVSWLFLAMGFQLC